MNGYPDVAPETRERVLAGIREHDFTPVRAARSLVTGRTHVVGVILETGAGHPDLQHPFFQEVLVGLKHTVGGLGYDLLLFSVETSGNGSAPAPNAAPHPAPNPASNVRGVVERHPEHASTNDRPDGPHPHRFLARARQHRVDGVVLMGVDRHDPEIEEVVRSGIAAMAVDLDLEGGRTGHVTSDNVTGASLAVRHLAELGHRTIGLVGGPGDMRPAVDRLMGYRRELDRLGIQHRAEYVREADFYPASGHAAMSALLDLPDPPTAVFVAGDLMAAGAIQAISERGLECPRDVALVGFDDIQIAGLLQPALTTIRQDKQGLGSAAGGSLVQLIDDPDMEPPVVVVPVELVVRDSSQDRRKDRGVERGKG
jgi:LacI family transcriptional regulator